MTDTIVIALPYFMENAKKIAGFLGADIREYTPEIFAEVFPITRRIVAVMSMGIVVRMIAPLIKDKWNDPAVIVVSPDISYAIPVLGGHHGANDLAKELSHLGIHPVITTATEATGRDSVEMIAQRNTYDVVNRNSTRMVNAAMLGTDVPVFAVKGPGIVIAGPDVSILMKKGEFTVGVGCRKGVGSKEVVDAIKKALEESGVAESDVLVYATTSKKSGETGLSDAISLLSGNLLFLDDDTINAQRGITPSRATRIGLRGVAEPCALAVARKKQLVLGKKVYGRVTVAIAH
ncbi:MAG: cobalt-precorrin 5A hydrolase [Methanoregula sp.]|jgi:cobalt-precorrin 5A hydrolase|nr:cobalt-precorrin 5A hydrolase [Methanoregula sp.]